MQQPYISIKIEDKHGNKIKMKAEGRHAINKAKEPFYDLSTRFVSGSFEYCQNELLATQNALMMKLISGQNNNQLLANTNRGYLPVNAESLRIGTDPDNSYYNN